ncbi:hypothetical protein FACS1894214_0920 [Planctomycetales bacterium]|nr:hypothetical protein FACS1894214_0920 [Planctomycetales bacterium]
MMTSFEKTLDCAADAVMNAFRVSGSYFYEAGQAGQRFAVDCVEKTLEFTETDKTGETFIKTGKAFYLKRGTIIEINTALGNESVEESIPHGGDYIVKIIDGFEERYQIDYREPFNVIGTNKALYRINTVFTQRNPLN